MANVAIIEQSTRIDVTPGAVPVVIHSSCHDTGRQFTCYLYARDNAAWTIPAGVTAKVHGTKPDSTGFEYDASINNDRTAVIFDLHEQMTAVEGRVLTEIVLTDTHDQVVNTANFILDVERPAMDDESLASATDVYNLMADIRAQVQAAQDAAEDAEAAAGSITGTEEACEQVYDDIKNYYNSKYPIMFNMAELAESYAHGMTGSREGENEDNSLYYMNMALAAAQDAGRAAERAHGGSVGLDIASFGAKGDGMTDDSDIFNEALSRYDVIYIPDGTYLISQPIYLKDGQTLVGQSHNAILKAGDETKSVLMVEGASLTNHRFITLKNFTVQFKGDGRTVWPVLFYNCSYCEMTDMKFEKTDDAWCATAGVSFSRYAGYRGNSYINKIHNCFFWLGGINFESSDSYIERNTIWAQQNPFAIRMEKASNSAIINNEIIPGDTCGIWVPNSQTDLQVTGNYFDGSYVSQDTGNMIQVDGSLDCSLIRENKFWRPQKFAIKGTISKSTISGNVIDNADFKGGRYAPFYFEGNCYALTLTDNTFTAIKYYDVNAGQEVQRPASLRLPPIHLENQSASGYGWTYLAGNTATYDDRWSDCEISGRVRSLQGGHFAYSYALDAATAIDGDVYTEGEGVNQKIYAKGAGEITPPHITYISKYYSQEVPLNMNSVVPVSGTYLINNPDAITGGPTDYTIAANDIIQVDNLYSGLTFYRLYTPIGVYYKYATTSSAGTWRIVEPTDVTVPEHTYITANWSSTDPLDFNTVTAKNGIYLLNDTAAVTNGPSDWTPANGDVIKVDQLYSGLTHYEIQTPGALYYKNATASSAGTWYKVTSAAV